MDEWLATHLRIGLEVLPVSALGWLGLRLLASAFLGLAERSIKFGGPYAFLVIWGLAVFVHFKTLGAASPVIHTLYASLFALGFVVNLVRLVVRAVLRTSKRQ